MDCEAGMDLDTPETRTACYNIPTWQLRPKIAANRSRLAGVFANSRSV